MRGASANAVYYLFLIRSFALLTEPRASAEARIREHGHPKKQR